MTAPVTSERITQVLAEVAGKHRILHYSYNGGRNAECVCVECEETVCRSSEQASPHGDRHSAHTAQMQAAALVPILAEVWADGHRQGSYDHGACPTRDDHRHTPNPYVGERQGRG